MSHDAVPTVPSNTGVVPSLASARNHAAVPAALADESLVMALAATLYPSWRASRINPAQALRYE